MVVLGILLIVVAAVAIVGAVVTLDGSNVEYLGFDVAPVTLFVAGAVSVALIWLGSKLLIVGTRRSVRARREHKRLNDLERRRDDTAPGEDPGNRPPPA